MTFENQGMNYQMPEVNAVENQEVTNNPPTNSENNAPNNMMNDGFFRNFIQFLQNPTIGIPINSGNVGNAQSVTV